MDDLATLGVDAEDIQGLTRPLSLSHKALKDLGITLSVDTGNIGVRTLVVLEVVDECVDDDLRHSRLLVFDFLVESFPEGGGSFLELSLSHGGEIGLTQFDGIRFELSVLLFSAEQFDLVQPRFQVIGEPCYFSSFVSGDGDYTSNAFRNAGFLKDNEIFNVSCLRDVTVGGMLAWWMQ